VAPPFGGAGDAFQPGITGLAPIDETPAALARVLGTLVGDERRRAEMGQAAAAWSRLRFEPAGYARHAVRALLGDALRIEET
jgi:hypothetical protein